MPNIINLLTDTYKFEIETNLHSQEISNRIESIVEFDHKKIYHTMLIGKNCYGNILEEGRYEIWLVPAIIASFNKGFSPKINIQIIGSKVLFEIEDILFSIMLFFIGLLFLSGLILLVAGDLNYPKQNTFIVVGGVFAVFSIVMFPIIRSRLYFTIKKTKRIFNSLLIS